MLIDNDMCLKMILISEESKKMRRFMTVVMLVLTLLIAGCNNASNIVMETYTPHGIYHDYGICEPQPPNLLCEQKADDNYSYGYMLHPENLPELTCDNLDESQSLLENAVYAVPNLLSVYVNETHFNVPSYYVEGQHYFYLRDVAYILQGTLAEFWLSLHGPYSPLRVGGIGGEVRYASPLDPTMWDVQHPWDIPIVPPLRHLAPDLKLAAPVTFGFNNQNWLAGGVFGIAVPMNAFEIDNRLYVDLWLVGQAMGFDTYFDIQAGSVHINTHQPFVSEYGRQVAEDFLSSFLDNGYYCQENEYIVWDYRLYNLDGSGIPAIVLAWGRDISRWNNQTLYIYGSGGFAAVGDIWLHIFYRSNQGELFLYSGDLGTYSGLFGRFYSVVPYDDGLHLKLLYSETWNNEQLPYPTEYISSLLADMDEDDFHNFMQQRFPMPAAPGYICDPLFRIRSFTCLS